MECVLLQRDSGLRAGRHVRLQHVRHGTVRQLRPVGRLLVRVPGVRALRDDGLRQLRDQHLRRLRPVGCLRRGGSLLAGHGGGLRRIRLAVVHQLLSVDDVRVHPEPGSRRRVELCLQPVFLCLPELRLLDVHDRVLVRAPPGHPLLLRGPWLHVIAPAG